MAIDQPANLAQILGAEFALLDQAEKVGLLVLYEHLARVDRYAICTQRDVFVDLSPGLIEPSALHQLSVRARYGCDMLAGFQPFSEYHRGMRVRCSQHHVGARDSFPPASGSAGDGQGARTGGERNDERVSGFLLFTMCRTAIER